MTLVDMLRINGPLLMGMIISLTLIYFGGNLLLRKLREHPDFDPAAE